MSVDSNVREGVELLGYRVEAVIGLGGMGVVYRAVDLRLKRTVALKLMAPELALDERFRTRFEREAELAMALEHPNVVPIHDAGEVDGRLFLAMRHVEGGTLRSLLREEGALAPARVVAIGRQVANALDAAHARGLVHRDVKPSNVLLDENEHVYLADFGLTRRLDEQGAHPGDNRSLGTPAYLAPEQLEGGPVDGRADVYSLGCLLFECLTGEPPFARVSRLAVAWAHLEEAPPAVTTRRPELPAEVDAVIEAAMAKDPAERPTTCAGLVDAVAVALGLGGAVVPAGSRRRRLFALLGSGVLLAAAALGAAAFLLTRDAEGIRAAGVAVLDAETGDVRETVPLGTAPANVAVGEGSAWIIDADDRTISQVDAKTRAVRRTFNPTSLPTDVAAGGGALWVANAQGPGAAEDSPSLFPESLSRLDVESGEVDATIPLPRFPGGHEFAVFPGLSRQQIALTPGAVWVINAKRTVSRIDPRTNRLVATIRGVAAENIAAGEGEVWVTEGDRLVAIDPHANRVSRRIPIAAETLSGLAVGAGAVWVSDPFGGKVWRVSTRPELRKRAIPLDEWVAGVAYGEGAVWVTNEIADAVYRIDPQTNAVRTARRTPAPRSVAVGAGAVWVTAASPPSADASLPVPPCGQVFYPAGSDPELLIVSDLPLKGDTRPFTKPMVEAIQHVLRRRGFKAGRHSVGYQSCDSSTAQGGVDPFRCVSNAKAYARNLKVVGVFGAYSSPCSYFQIPIANRAPEGALAMLSPSNTHRELTTNRDLYPTGARNYARIAGADHLQAVAHAEFLHLLGRRRLVTLAPRNDEDFARFVAEVGVAARRLGLDVAGSALYDAEARDFTGLAQRVAQARPEAVVVAGILLPGTGALIRNLRAALGPRVPVVAPDGFALADDLVQLAGPAAHGRLYVSQYGLPNSHLPPRGRRFLDAFAATQGTGPGPDFAAVYGAQGAELLLDAIARSDGSRSSVLSELRRTNVADGLLGTIRFDRNGDLEQAPFTFFRVAGDAFVVDRVVTARVALLRG